MIETVPVEGHPETEADNDWVRVTIPTPEEIEELREEGRLSWGE